MGVMKFDYQPADKLGKLLRGQKDTFSIAGASAAVAPAVFFIHLFHRTQTVQYELNEY